MSGVMGGGAWRPGFSLAGRGVGGRELQGPGALGYLVGVVLGLLRGRRRDRSCGVCW